MKKLGWKGLGEKLWMKIEWTTGLGAHHQIKVGYYFLSNTQPTWCLWILKNLRLRWVGFFLGIPNTQNWPAGYFISGSRPGLITGSIFDIRTTMVSTSKPGLIWPLRGLSQKGQGTSVGGCSHANFSTPKIWQQIILQFEGTYNLPSIMHQACVFNIYMINVFPKKLAKLVKFALEFFPTFQKKPILLSTF